MGKNAICRVTDLVRGALLFLHVGGDQKSGRDAIFPRLIIREFAESVLLATVSIIQS